MSGTRRSTKRVCPACGGYHGQKTSHYCPDGRKCWDRGGCMLCEQRLAKGLLPLMALAAVMLRATRGTVLWRQSCAAARLVLGGPFQMDDAEAVAAVERLMLAVDEVIAVSAGPDGLAATEVAS